MNIGDKVIVKPRSYGIYKQFKTNIPFNSSKAIILEFDNIGRACVAFDKFPKVNDREKKNRYWYYLDELEVLE